MTMLRGSKQPIVAVAAGIGNLDRQVLIACRCARSEIRYVRAALSMSLLAQSGIEQMREPDARFL
jgi:hypothetical protein